jgi:hypothetical protein
MDYIIIASTTFDISENIPLFSAAIEKLYVPPVLIVIV